MSVVGARSFGRVESYGGEYACTTFAHVNYLPLFPQGSVWVTQTGERFPILPHYRSIVAAYIRIWGLLAVVTASWALSGAARWTIDAILIALLAWAWSWRWVRGAARRRLSNVRAAALGWRCDPTRLDFAHRAKLGLLAEERWQALGSTRTPEDIAQFGAAKRGEAELAYAVIALSFADRGDLLVRAADAVLAGVPKDVPIVDAPYRQLARVSEKPADDAPRARVHEQSWGERELCGDGACTGLVRGDGRCSTCGKTLSESSAR
jgi:hypothetical protein